MKLDQGALLIWSIDLSGAERMVAFERQARRHARLLEFSAS